MKASEDSYTEDRAQRIAYLVAGFIRQRLTDKEHDELDEWITASDANQELFEELVQPEFADKGMKELGSINTEAAYNKIRQRIQFNKPDSKKGNLQMLFRIAAAVIVVAGLAVFYYLMNRSSKPQNNIAQVSIIKPGGNYATLTLGNGRSVEVNNMQPGLVESVDGLKLFLRKSDGQLSYADNAKADDDVHTLSTPIGGQFHVVLPDGSNVWLNAASSLKYPVHFSKDERVVELSGEGYFEIKPLSPKGGQEKIPFRVIVNGVEVEVLGTHFNVNAYGDEGGVNTTLLEGSVRLRKESRPLTMDDGQKNGNHADDEQVILKPGEQGVLMENGKLKVESGIDTDEVVAWKNGVFSFKDASIENILKQAARWYDIEVVYQGKIERHFNAEVLRSESIEKLLKLLELTGSVHFKIENKKVYVLP